MSEKLMAEVRGAVARGWCTPENSDKEMDAVLAEAIVASLVESDLVVDRSNMGEVSDGYHTFNELYDHRITLYIALCRVLDRTTGWRVWRSNRHSDGSTMDGWFIMGIGTAPGNQITYHLPVSRWQETDFAETLDKAPEWDGHTSENVLNRLGSL